MLKDKFGLIALLILVLGVVLMLVSLLALPSVGRIALVSYGLRGVSFLLLAVFLVFATLSLWKKALGKRSRNMAKTASKTKSVLVEFAQFALSVVLYSVSIGATFLMAIFLLLGDFSYAFWGMVVVAAVTAPFAIWWWRRKKKHPRKFKNIAAGAALICLPLLCVGAFVAGAVSLYCTATDWNAEPVYVSGILSDVHHSHGGRRSIGSYQYTLTISDRSTDEYANDTYSFSSTFEIKDDRYGLALHEGDTCSISFYPRSKVPISVELMDR